MPPATPCPQASVGHALRGACAQVFIQSAGDWTKQLQVGHSAPALSARRTSNAAQWAVASAHLLPYVCMYGCLYGGRSSKGSCELGVDRRRKPSRPSTSERPGGRCGSKVSACVRRACVPVLAGERARCMRVGSRWGVRFPWAGPFPSPYLAGASVPNLVLVASGIGITYGNPYPIPVFRKCVALF